MYPDIIIITEASVGLSCKTLESVAKYASYCSCLIKPNMGIDREKGQLTQRERLAILRKSTSEYVLVMDDDDELVSPVPAIGKIKDFDVIFFNYTQDGSQKRDFRTCRPFQIFSFCGTIIKKEIAVKALEYTVKQKCLREDIGFFYFIVNNISNIHFSQSVLINKIGQREPWRSSWLMQGFRNEFENIWRDKINDVRLKC